MAIISTENYPYINNLIIEVIISLIFRSYTGFESLTYSPFSTHKTSANIEHNIDTKIYPHITYLNKENFIGNDSKKNSQFCAEEFLLNLPLIVKSMNKDIEAYKDF